MEINHFSNDWATATVPRKKKKETGLSKGREGQLVALQKPPLKETFRSKEIPFNRVVGLKQGELKA